MQWKPLFTGKLVRLAAPRADDYAVFSKWQDNDEYLRIMDNDPARPLSPEQYMQWEKEHFDGPIKGSHMFFFRVRTLAEDQLIGIAGVGVDWMHRTANMGVSIGDPEYWGKGYGSDAIQLILNYAFSELNIYRVGISTIAYNERAARAYEKAGFRHEGAWRRAIERQGERFDVVQFGILREEWEGRSE